MIDFLIKSTISLTVLLIFYHFVLEREKMHQYNRFYLLFAIVISIVIPFLTFDIIKVIPVVKYIEPLNTIAVSSVVLENEIVEKVTPLQLSINYTPYILWSLYGLISLELLIRFAKNIFKLIEKIKSNPNINFQNATLVLIDEKTLPHTFWKTIFINFEDYNNRTIEDELYTHELVHVSQKHTLDILFIETLKVVFWFNPLFYFYKKAIQLNHEFLADEKVVTSYNNVTFYQNLLLQKSSNVQTIYLASNLNYLITKKRLIMMTKNTSQKITILKKIAIVPVLAGLIYFFCVEIVAQRKFNNKATTAVAVSGVELGTSKTDDEIRDKYYEGVRIILTDNRYGIEIDKIYDDLTLEQKRKYLNWIPSPMNENKPTKELLAKLSSTNNNAIWINESLTTCLKLKEYKTSDLKHYTSSFVHKNARSKKFPQEYQYHFYTNDYFDKNLKTLHLKFSNDTLKMVISKYDNPTKKVSKILNSNQITDTLVWYTGVKEDYNLYLSEKKAKKIIVIDAGHGGHDFGATKDDLNEKNIVSEITNKIKDLYSDSDVVIHFTRIEDDFISLNDRTDFINNIKPDLVISLHINSNNNSNKNGFEIFVTEKNDLFEKSKVFAEKLSIKLSKTPLKNNGLKTAPFWILKKTNSPSLLVEIGYISNEDDRKFMTSEKGQTEIAKSILEFVDEIN